MVFERYHLRALQMSVARHHPRVFLCNTLQRGAEGVDKSGHTMCLLLDVQLHIHIALVVAAAGGVQLFAHVPYAAYQVQLHKGMHILVFFGVNKLPGLEIGQDGFQAPGERLSLGGGEQAAFYLHGHMGKAALDIWLHQPAGAPALAVEMLHQRVLIAAEAPSPQFGFIGIRHIVFPPVLYCVLCAAHPRRCSVHGSSPSYTRATRGERKL